MLFKIIGLLKYLGFVGMLLYIYNRIFEQFFTTGHLRVLISKHALHPLLYRPETSDIKVFRQIFGIREYSCIDDVHDADLIIDCGAYVGYSSAYFLSRFLNCYLVAIEPDPENCLMLQKKYGTLSWACFDNSCRRIAQISTAYIIGRYAW